MEKKNSYAVHKRTCVWEREREREREGERKRERKRISRKGERIGLMLQREGTAMRFEWGGNR